ncbi:MAG: AAA family ATPase, partial [Fimbriiglobus sp.]
MAVPCPSDGLTCCECGGVIKKGSPVESVSKDGFPGRRHHKCPVKKYQEADATWELERNESIRDALVGTPDRSFDSSKDTGLSGRAELNHLDGPDAVEPPPGMPHAPETTTAGIPEALAALVEYAGNKAADVLMGRHGTMFNNMVISLKADLETRIVEEAKGLIGHQVHDQIEDMKRAIADVAEDVASGVRQAMQKELDGIAGLKRVEKVFKIADRETVFDADELFHVAFDEIVTLITNGFHVFIPGPSGCISGDMWLRYVARKNGKLVNKKGGRFDTLYQRFHGLPPKPGKPAPKSGCEYYIQSVRDDGTVFLNRIVNVIDSGVKEVFWVTTVSGKRVKATADHQFMTEFGYTELGDMSPGDTVVSVPRVAQATGRKPRPYRKEVLVKHHRDSTVKVVNGCKYHRIKVYHAVVEADMNGMGYDEYVLFLNTQSRDTIDNLKSIPAGYDVHHKDENCDNNALENLEVIQSEVHDAIHSTGSKIYAECDKIASIEPAGTDRVYDLVVADPYRNFVVGDIVVHNCGKTFTAKQVAKVLGLRYGMISGSAGVTESHLFGTAFPNVATGESRYMTSSFIDIFENGGLFFLDELDAMDPNCLLAVNAALGNGYCPVPRRFDNPIAEQHPDFRFIAAANTWGQGANRMYCGRNKLDEATLDRFRGGTVPMDYDAAIELRWACPDVELYQVLKGWRERVMANGFQRI